MPSCIKVKPHLPDKSPDKIAECCYIMSHVGCGWGRPFLKQFPAIFKKYIHYRVCFCPLDYYNLIISVSDSPQTACTVTLFLPFFFFSFLAMFWARNWYSVKKNNRTFLTIKSQVVVYNLSWSLQNVFDIEDKNEDKKDKNNIEDMPGNKSALDCHK